MMVKKKKENGSFREKAGEPNIPRGPERRLFAARVEHLLLRGKEKVDG